MIESEFTEEKSDIEKFIVGVIVSKTSIQKSKKTGCSYVKWRISDLSKCRKDFIDAAKNRSNKYYMSKLSEKMQSLILSSA